MMEIRKLRRLLPFLLILLYACQSEEPQEKTEPARVYTVKAALPGNESSRAHITYGNLDIDKELFRWDNIEITGAKKNDYIAVYDISKIKSYLDDVQLDVIQIDGRTAIFETLQSVPSGFKIEAGDTLFVNYFDTDIIHYSDGSVDPRKIFEIVVGTEANKPQYIVANPTDSMQYMQFNLKMYDIVVATEDEKIPDLHFRPLSAIIRITLRNETDKYLYPTKLECSYPETQSFFNTTLYCSVDPDPTNISGLKVYTEKEFFKGSDPYTDNIGTTINGKIGTKDAGDSIPPGKTYNLYMSTVPRIGNKQKGDKFSISLITNHDTNHPYTITIDGFDTAIEAGQRYWFNLTAVEEDTIRKLVYTKEWLDQHPGAE